MFGLLVPQLADDLETPRTRRVDIQDQHIGAQLPDLLLGLPAFNGLADELEVRVQADQSLEPFSNDRLIACDHQTDHRIPSAPGVWTGREVLNVHFSMFMLLALGTHLLLYRVTLLRHRFAQLQDRRPGGAAGLSVSRSTTH